MKHFIFLSFCLLVAVQLYAQQDHFLYGEVQELNKKYKNRSGKVNDVLFTGSSSIRMWTDLEKRFPNYAIMNTGFGGSKMIDLDLFLEDLVLQYQPKTIFIYEGDNDISIKLSIASIKKTTKIVLAKIRKQLPNSSIVLIAAKPSIARWNFKRKYKRLNRFYKRYAKRTENIAYANIWDSMLEGNVLKKDIFISDGLHLNQKGYDLWEPVIAPFLKQ